MHALLIALAAVAPAAQDDDEDQLTPAQVREALQDIHRMMELAERLLNDSSRGRALETEQALLDRYRDQFGDVPLDVLEKVRKLAERAEKKQKDVIDRLAELIKKAREARSNPPKERQPGDETREPRGPDDGAKKPYGVNRTAQPGDIFRSKGADGGWGGLPPKDRPAALQSWRALDEYPPEFQQVLKEYYEELGK